MVSNRKQQVVVTVAASTDWQVVELPLLMSSGVLVHAAYRLAASGTPGNIDVKVIDGPYAAGMTTAAIAAIPDDDVAYSEAAIALVASATTATKTNIQGSVSDAAVYDRRGGGNANYSQEARHILLAVRGDGVTVGDVTITFRARDCTR
jgi:hypothetical protein